MILDFFFLFRISTILGKCIEENGKHWMNIYGICLSRNILDYAKTSEKNLNSTGPIAI